MVTVVLCWFVGFRVLFRLFQELHAADGFPELLDVFLVFSRAYMIQLHPVLESSVDVLDTLFYRDEFGVALHCFTFQRYNLRAQ